MEKLGKELVAIGNELSQLRSGDRLDVSLLKRLRAVELEPYLSKKWQPKDRFLAFFLIIFLDDVFYNMVGDFPYDDETYGEKADEIRVYFFTDVARYLSAIGQALYSSDSDAINEILVSLVTSYLDKIDEINALIG